VVFEVNYSLSGRVVALDDILFSDASDGGACPEHPSFPISTVSPPISVTPTTAGETETSTDVTQPILTTPRFTGLKRYLPINKLRGITYNVFPFKAPPDSSSNGTISCNFDEGGACGWQAISPETKFSIGRPLLSQDIPVSAGNSFYATGNESMIARAITSSVMGTVGMEQLMRVRMSDNFPIFSASFVFTQPVGS
jgi:hypothetical protein